MAQQNDTDVKDEGVTVTTTPKFALSASLTAKFAATSTNSTSFNIKTTTSIIPLDAFSFGCVGFTTSKKIGATVTYQCGKNGESFATSSKSKTYAYAKDLTFAYIKGMAIRGTNIDIVNKQNIFDRNIAGLALLAGGSLATPIVSFGAEVLGKKKDWATSEAKKKRRDDAAKQKDAEYLDAQKQEVNLLSAVIRHKNKKIDELQQKSDAGTITEEEKKKLSKLQDDVSKADEKREDIQDEIDHTEKKNQKKKEDKANIGGSPDNAKAIATYSNIGAAALAGVTTTGAALAAGLQFFNYFDKDKGIYISTDDDLVMNATSGAAPEFCAQASEDPFGQSAPNASLKIKHADPQKLAEFNAVAKFTAKVGTTSSMACEESSVTLTQAANSAKIEERNVVLKCGVNSMTLSPSEIKIKVGSLDVTITNSKLEIAGVSFQ